MSLSVTSDCHGILRFFVISIPAATLKARLVCSHSNDFKIRLASATPDPVSMVDVEQDDDVDLLLFLFCPCFLSWCVLLADFRKISSWVSRDFPVILFSFDELAVFNFWRPAQLSTVDLRKTSSFSYQLAVCSHEVVPAGGCS